MKQSRTRFKSYFACFQTHVNANLYPMYMYMMYGKINEIKKKKTFMIFRFFGFRFSLPQIFNVRIKYMYINVKVNFTVTGLKNNK